MINDRHAKSYNRNKKLISVNLTFKLFIVWRLWIFNVYHFYRFKRKINGKKKNIYDSSKNTYYCYCLIDTDDIFVLRWPKVTINYSIINTFPFYFAIYIPLKESFLVSFETYIVYHIIDHSKQFDGDTTFKTDSNTDSVGR